MPTSRWLHLSYLVSRKAWELRNEEENKGTKSEEYRKRGTKGKGEKNSHSDDITSVLKLSPASVGVISTLSQ